MNQPNTSYQNFQEENKEQPSEGVLPSFLNPGAEMPSLSDLKNDMFSELNMAQINTLNEPVSTTINRDFKMIGRKLKYVIIPKFTLFGAKREERLVHLKNWDLWGPLLLTITMALILNLTTYSDSDYIFGELSLIIFTGATIVTLNAKFLGAKISFLQTVCLLGYCLFPIWLSTILIACFKSILMFWGKTILCMVAFLWSSLASVPFMHSSLVPEKKFLGLYPIFLFYLLLSWLALSI